MPMNVRNAKFVVSVRSDRTHRTRRPHHRDGGWRSSSASKLDDRHMLATGVVANVQVEPDTSPASNPRLRASAAGSTWPPPTRLESWCAASGRLVEVDFIRRPTVQPGMWPITVIPSGEQRQLLAKGFSAAGDEYPPRAFVFHRENEPFDNGDAAVLTHGTESLTDAAATTPLPEPGRRELLAMIADQVLWCGSDISNHPTEKSDDVR